MRLGYPSNLYVDSICPSSPGARRFRYVVLLMGFAALALPNAQAQSGRSFIARYQERVSATQAEQPHWITPLVTVTPRLEQEVRSDFVRQTNSKLQETWNFGNGKGLEIIPERHIELLFNFPPFIAHQAGAGNDGFGDVSFNSKYRFYARNEEHGNAIITAFLAGSYPTGKNGNGSCCASITPTLAVGKGFGLVALTSTAGGSIPASNTAKLGHTIAWNNVIQYRVAHTGAGRLFWPELESNSSFFKGGSNDGKATSFLTPGIVIGRISLVHDASGKPGRLGLTFGAGEQIAVTHFYSNNHNLVFTLRMPF
ncbi:MAG: hypothetical protein WCA10_14025 [Terracidiphilus sp.]